MYIYNFPIQSQVGGEIKSIIKGGHCRVGIKFAQPIKESVTVILYAKFPSEIKIDSARNVIL